MRIAFAFGLLFLTGCGWSACDISYSAGADDSRQPGGYAPEQAREILNQAAANYTASESYKDEGLVSTTFVNGCGERVVDKPFRTAFVRPDRFRFEYQEREAEGTQTEYIVWADGDEVRTWGHFEPQLREAEDLSQGVARATGVSSGSAHVVPRLLLPDEVSGFALTELEELEMLGEEEIDGAACYKMQGKHPRDGWRRLWIEKDRMLIRRIDEQSQFDTFHTVTTMTYTPQINIEIASDDLAFAYPGSE